MNRPSWTLSTPLLGLLLVVLGACVTLPWRVDGLFHERTDAAIYVLTAKSLLAGDGYTYLGDPFVLRPPGLPVLLLPVLAAFGQSFFALNLWVSIFSVGCIALMYLHGARRTDALVAAAAAAVVWFNPTFTRLSFEILSDVPSAMLLMLVLVWEGRSDRPSSLARDVGLGVLIGCAAYVRTSTVLVAPAILAARLLHRSRGELAMPRVWLSAGVPALVAFALLVPWLVRNQVNAPPAPAEHTVAYSYGTAMWNVDRADPASERLGIGDIAARIPAQVTSGAHSIALGLTGERAWLPASLGLAALIVVFLRRREAPEIFALGSIAVLAVFFVYHPRFAIPLLLIGAVAFAEVVRGVSSLVLPPRGASFLTAAALALLAWQQPPTPVDGDGVAQIHARYVDAAQTVSATCGPADTVAALQGAQLSLFLGRPVYSVRFTYDRSGLPALRDLLERRDVDCVYFEPTSLRHRRLRRFFRRRFEEEVKRPGYAIFRGRRG